MDIKNDSYEFRPIAYVRSDFPGKFGIPRQSGIAKSLSSRLVFLPEYGTAEMLRGLESFSYLWLLWCFSENRDAGWSPTVRPPRLGGNRRMGLWATRSPFRPNPIGLSSVRLLDIVRTEEGTELLLGGADLMDGTPVLDIKPYVPYADSHPEAAGGFTSAPARKAEVRCEAALLEKLPPEKREALLEILQEDPRPSYQDDPERVYGFGFAGREIRFSVKDGVLTVCAID